MPGRGDSCSNAPPRKTSSTRSARSTKATPCSSPPPSAGSRPATAAARPRARRGESHRTGERGPAAHRPGPVQRRDRRRAVPRRGDRQDPRTERAGQARRPGPRPGRHHRLRERLHPLRGAARQRAALEDLGEPPDGSGERYARGQRRAPACARRARRRASGRSPLPGAGRPSPGAPADELVYDADPRTDHAPLDSPRAFILRGPGRAPAGGGRDLTCHGQPVPGTSTGRARISPVRGPVVSRSRLATWPSA